ncbi:MAG: hypothetical protein AAGI71_01905 [Bacteroidota bacterium]
MPLLRPSFALLLLAVAVGGCASPSTTEVSPAVDEDDVRLAVERRLHHAASSLERAEDFAAFWERSHQQTMRQQNERQGYYDSLYAYSFGPTPLTQGRVQALQRQAEALIARIGDAYGDSEQVEAMRYVGTFTLKLLYQGTSYRDVAEKPYFIDLAIEGESTKFALILDAIERLGADHPDTPRLAYAALVQFEAALQLDFLHVSDGAYIKGLGREPMHVDTMRAALAVWVDPSALVRGE